MSPNPKQQSGRAGRRGGRAAVILQTTFVWSLIIAGQMNLYMIYGIDPLGASILAPSRRVWIRPVSIGPARGGARPSAHSAALALRGRVGPSLAIGGVEMVRAALLLSLACMQAQGNMYDVFERHKLPPVECAHGCAAWADAAEARPELNITAMWAVSGKVPVEAGKYCAIPGMVGGRTGMAAGETTADVLAADAGSFCFCEGTMEPHYCVSAHGVAEQINLQIASSNTIVVGFVTFEAAMPVEPPIAEFGMAAASPSLWAAAATELQGISHWYMEKSNATCTGGAGPCATVGRNYTMSFIKFHSLEHSTQYTYRVKSGGQGAVWSDTFTFRTPAADGGPTKLGIYGDMGVYAWNNMQNLQEDCRNGDIDAIVHMGDHVYYWAGDDNKRGDAYMNAFQPTLAECPWMPFLGNHEYNDADNSWRYVNQTWGTAYGQENSVSGDTMPDEELCTQTDR